MANQAPAARRVTRRKRSEGEPEKGLDVSGFRRYLIQFLSNKMTAESLVLRNDGDKKKEVPGIKAWLLNQVIVHGDRDPETGSYFLELDEPVVVENEKVTKVKAERRTSKYLDVDKVRAFLSTVQPATPDGDDEDHPEPLDLVPEVERFVYNLLLTPAEADAFNIWLGESKYIQRVTGTDCVIEEDALLQLHYGKSPVTGEDLVDPTTGESYVSADQLDALYVEDETFAFKPLK